MKECPYCGGDEYIRKDQARGPVYYRERFDDKEADNSQMYDALNIEPGKYVYCADCGRRLWKVTWED